MLATHPDYFKTPVEPFVALTLTAPADRLGTFHLEVSDDGGAKLSAALGPGRPVTTYLGYQGIISVSQFSGGQGGEADGSFDLHVAGTTGNVQEIFGKFKTSGCTSLSSAQF